MGKQLTIDELNFRLKKNGVFVKQYSNMLAPTTIYCSLCGGESKSPPRVYIYTDRLCPICNSSKNINYIYIAEDTVGVKIGMSKQPKRRIRNINSRSNTAFKLEKVFPIGDKSKTEAIEKIVHGRLWKFKTEVPKTIEGHSEIFSISVEEAEKYIVEAMDLLC